MKTEWFGEGDLAWLEAETEEEAKFLEDNKHLPIYTVLEKWRNAQRS